MFINNLTLVSPTCTVCVVLVKPKPKVGWEPAA